jgi:D-amino-acid oxidase
MNRRAFLQGAVRIAAVGGVAGLFAGCESRRIHSPSPAFLPTLSGRPLAPVHASADREIRTTVGLRPFRPSGFVVRAEKFDDTLVVHNYGHGGGGITLSWGTARLAVDLAIQGYSGTAAVLGCGAVGLATARLLQESGLRVVIYAQDLPPQTTSNMAGGQWFPYLVSDHRSRTGAFLTQFLSAARYAYGRYQTMIGTRYGVRWIRNYYLQHEPWQEDSLHGFHSPLASMMPELRDLTPREHPFAGYEYVRQFDTMLIEPPVYLAAMLEAFRIAGGTVVVRKMQQISDVTNLPEKLVFNCTGLGAKALFNDDELVPVKGQLTVLLPQPEIDYNVLHDDLYMFPRTDGILLGGTHEEGVWSLEPNLEAKQRILAAHQNFFEQMRTG